MRISLRLDDETIATFGLSPDQTAEGNHLLSLLGSRASDDLAGHALSISEPASSAALWVAVRAAYPWPWLAAELDGSMGELSEGGHGFKLHCALLARVGGGSEPGAPQGLAKSLESIGAKCSPWMANPSDLASMGHHRRMELRQALQAGADPMLPPRLDEPALAAWALPVLYTPANFGPYERMPAKERALLAQSCADLIQKTLASQASPNSHVLLGFGPMRSILAQGPSLCAPLRFRTLLESLCRNLFMAAQDIAVSVSFHAQGDREWIRVGLRPADTGLRLSGMDWPSAQGEAEHEFDRLLDTLSSCGVQWCHQVQGRFDALLCAHCGEPIYPNPAHEPWTRAALEAGAPSDGSHAH